MYHAWPYIMIKKVEVTHGIHSLGHSTCFVNKAMHCLTHYQVPFFHLFSPQCMSHFSLLILSAAHLLDSISCSHPSTYSVLVTPAWLNCVHWCSGTWVGWVWVGCAVTAASTCACCLWGSIQQLYMQVFYVLQEYSEFFSLHSWSKLQRAANCLWLLGMNYRTKIKRLIYLLTMWTPTYILLFLLTFG